MSRLDFVVRADSSTEGEAEAAGSEEASEAIVEAEAEPVVESEPEEPKTPRKSRVKLGDIMGILNKRAVEAAVQERPVPDIRTGDVVQIKLEVPENKRRLSVYKGIVISRQNAGIHTTIRIRRIIAGIGVEIVFPLLQLKFLSLLAISPSLKPSFKYSPNIKELKVLSHRKVRRARLYYLRDKLPSS
ncbi:Ribosomal protein L19 family protein [Prunus dulcis]|uniref:Ribosomal protein L19 family protein n=1 Tax=Prunus dulcis TaxID=3755 RepID=A0A4Y1RG79_PRUDU|nr:Ribosomal protein L19 family protein [Prunus dulcis]